MRKRSLIVIGILIFATALLIVPLVLAGEGRASFSKSVYTGGAVPVSSYPAQGSISMTHSLSQAINTGSVACLDDATGFHLQTSYLRRFTLADFGITGDFNVTDVEVGVEGAAAGTGGLQPATINLFTWDPNDPFTYANFNLIGTVDVDVPDSSLTKILYTASGTAPSGSTLVAEFLTPNGVPAGNNFWFGSNALGQTDDSFVAAPECAAPDPVTTGAIGFPEMMIVMNVYGDEVFRLEMSFSKTVGFDPGSCATNDEVSVPAGMGGTDVTYCYTLNNTGNLSLTYHTVEDDQLGTLLGPDYMVDVGPGETYYFTETATITETTVNVATWSVTDDGVVVISDTDTATVTQQAPTSVALSGIEVQTSNWLVPVAFVVIVSIFFGAAFVLRRRTTV